MPVLTLLPGTRVVATGPATVAEGFTLAGGDPPGDPADLVVVPGGDLEAAWSDAALLDHLARAPRVAGICNGVVLLGRAGRLVGKRVTHTAHAPYATRPTWADYLDTVEPVLAGSVYVDEDVVVDGDLVTARPWAAISFARALGGSARQARYLRGIRDMDGEDPHQRWVAELTPIPGVETALSHVQAHVGYLRRLEARGLLSLAGPFDDGTGGILVLRARDEAEALAMATADPFVSQGVRRLTLRRLRWSCADNDHLGVAPG